MEFYLKEAFQSLKLLEDDFNLTADQGVIDELQSFVADDIEAPAEEEIIDVEADEVEDLQDNYIGKVILECDSCHTRIYKDIADVIIDEDSGLANVEEECPVCSNAFGWNVIGRIEKFDADAFKEEPEDEKKEEIEVEDEPEISDEEIGEALKEALNEDRFEDGSVDQEMLNSDVYNALSDVAYENEVNGGTNTKAGFEKAEKNFNDKFFSLDDRDFDEESYDDSINEGFIDTLKSLVTSTSFSRRVMSREGKVRGTEILKRINGLLNQGDKDTALKIMKNYIDNDKLMRSWGSRPSKTQAEFNDMLPGADKYADEFIDKFGTSYKESCDNSIAEEFENPEDVGANPETASDHVEKLETPMDNPVEELPDKLVVKESLNEDDHSLGSKDLRGKNITVAEYVKDHYNEIPWRLVIYEPVKSDSSPDGFFLSDSHISKEFASKKNDIIDFIKFDNDNAGNPELAFYIKGAKPEISLFDESLNEDLNEVEVHTDEQDIEVKTEDGKVVVEVGNPEEPEAAAEDEMIAPLDAKEITDIENNEEQSAEEVATEDESDTEEESPTEDELDIDEFDEESFDEIGESYLHRVYENVNSFKTTGVTLNKGQLVVEGLIKFNSGKEKKTSFVFEGFKNTKRGKVVTEGKNETFSKSNKAFVLKGTLSDKKFISESLIYNYTAKTINESNESEATRVYGRAVRK